MIKKILFQTLQRFDLEDANELQSGVLDKLQKLILAFRPYKSAQNNLGRPAANVTVDSVSNSVVTFDPFTVVTEGNDIISFDSQDVSDGLTQVNISETFNNFVTQTNNGENLAGIYFYAYPLYENGENENREFFSVVDNAAVTQNVATRQLSKLTYFTNFDASYRIADANGNQPIALGYVAAGNILVNNASSPFLPSNFISFNYFDEAYGNDRSWDDNSLPNVANDRHTSQSTNFVPGDLVNGDGLHSPFERVQRDIQRIMSFGTSDRTDTDLINVQGKPQYSLQGLKKEIETVETTVNQNLVVHLDTAVLTPNYSTAWTTNVVGTTDQSTARSTIILDQETPFTIIGYETATLATASRGVTDLGPTGDGSNFLIGDAKNYQILLPLEASVSTGQVISVSLEGAGTIDNDQRGRYPSGIFGSLCGTVTGSAGNYYPWNSATVTPGIVFQTSLSEIGIFHNQVVEYFKDNDGEYAAPEFRLLVKIYGKKST